PLPPPDETSVPTNTPVPTPTKISCIIRYNQTVDGVISDDSPETRYCLIVSAGDWVAIRMFAAQEPAPSVANGSLDTYLKLYAPDGSLLASDDDGAQVDSNSFMVRQLS